MKNSSLHIHPHASPLWVALIATASLVISGFAANEAPQGEPKVIDPGPPPSDALVLFDGKDLMQWESEDNRPAKWDVKDGVMTVNHTGYIHTKQAFGSCQLHVEWATPAEVSGEGQGRGNSGIF